MLRNEIKKFWGAAFRLSVMIVLIGSVAEASISTGPYPGNSFIDPTVLIDVGNFSIGKESYIAPFTSFTGEYAYIGSYSNVQDSGSNSGKIRIKDDAVVAHGADLRGEVEVGSKSFIGFNSLIKDAKIGDGAYIGIGSKVVGVDIPSRKSVPPASIIDSAEDIVALKPVTEEEEEFVEDVIEVNRALAAGYSQLFERKGLDAFGKVGPHGDGDIIIDGKDILAHSGSHEPVVGEGTVIDNSRIIGHVILRKNTRVGDGTSIRGDEGIPIDIGDNAQIGKNNTFHSLNGKEVMIGKNFNLGSDSVIHGPLKIGDNVRAGNTVVVFKSEIGNNVEIGDNALVIGVKVPDGTVIPPGSVVTRQSDVRKLNPEPESKPASIPELAIVAIIPMALAMIGSYFFREK